MAMSESDIDECAYLNESSYVKVNLNFVEKTDTRKYNVAFETEPVKAKTSTGATCYQINLVGKIEAVINPEDTPQQKAKTKAKAKKLHQDYIKQAKTFIKTNVFMDEGYKNFSELEMIANTNELWYQQFELLLSKQK